LTGFLPRRSRFVSVEGIDDSLTVSIKYPLNFNQVAKRSLSQSKIVAFGYKIFNKSNPTTALVDVVL
jgi:hypothetical protein